MSLQSPAAGDPSSVPCKAASRGEAAAGGSPSADPRQPAGPQGREAPENLNPFDLDFWTPAAVRRTMEGAARAIDSIPVSRRDFPAELKAAWPETVKRLFEDEADPAALERPRLKCTAREISQAIEAITWLMLIERERHRRIVAARLFGLTWTCIKKMDGWSREWCAQVYARAFEQIARAVNTRARFKPDDFREIGKLDSIVEARGR